MQLDWVHTRLAPQPENPTAPDSGLPQPHSSVGTIDSRPRLKGSRFSWVLVAAVALLGQGERFTADARFATPSATLQTYWTALGRGDAEEVWECFVEGRNDLPMPGMLWFLPPVDGLALADFRSLPVTRGRVLVSYEVRYIPQGFAEERSFRTGDELVRVRGAWRIAQPVGTADMPDLGIPPRPVDI